MEQTLQAPEDYRTPVVLDAGDVGEVTLGTKTFDHADDTQYKYA